MNYLEAFRQIDTLIFDVDGVMTNSELIVLENGDLLRKMNVRDGYAIKRALAAGIRIAIITGGSSTGVVARLQQLGIQDVFHGVQNKLEVFRQYVAEHELDPMRILYMGDDLPDYKVMTKVGIPACPNDAAPEIIQISNYISPYVGGAGCVRDVIERLLRLRQVWTPKIPFEIEQPKNEDSELG